MLLENGTPPCLVQPRFSFAAFTPRTARPLADDLAASSNPAPSTRAAQPHLGGL